MVVKTPPKLPYFLYKSYKMFLDFFPFPSFYLFSFFKGEENREGKNVSLTQLGRPCRYLLRRRREEFDCYMYYTRICMCFIDNSSSTRRRRRSGVLRISSEEIDKKLMYLE